jgi:hypothetical protein
LWMDGQLVKNQGVLCCVTMIKCVSGLDSVVNSSSTDYGIANFC